MRKYTFREELEILQKLYKKYKSNKSYTYLCSFFDKNGYNLNDFNALKELRDNNGFLFWWLMYNHDELKPKNTDYWTNNIRVHNIRVHMFEKAIKNLKIKCGI